MGRALASRRAALTRGSLSEQLGVFLGLIRGILKLMFSECPVCTGGMCWGARTSLGKYGFCAFRL